MFLQWKLIFQKTNLKYFTFISLGGLFFLLLILFTNDSCAVDNYLISNEILTYEKSLDPEYCENIVEKIDVYNDHCVYQIEILDCG